MSDRAYAADSFVLPYAVEIAADALDGIAIVAASLRTEKLKNCPDQIRFQPRAESQDWKTVPYRIGIGIGIGK